MKEPFLSGIAALLLATGAAHSASAYAGEVWRFDNYKGCTATTEFKRSHIRPDEVNGWPTASLERRDPALGPRGGPAPSVLEEPDTAIVVFKRKHLAKLEAAVRYLKKCRAWIYIRPGAEYRGKVLNDKGRVHYLTPKEMKELDNAD
jgi:hypothetical protein